MTRATPSPEESDLPREIGMPARRAFAAVGLTTLDQLAGRSEAELARLHGVGPKALGVIRRALEARGESFA